MTTIAIKDFKQKKVYDKLVSKKIMSYWKEMFFNPLFKIVGLKAKNEGGLIIEALRSGKIFYQDGIFKQKSKISNNLALEFKKLGATYNKTLRGWQFKELPPWLTSELERIANENQKTLEQINNLLSDFQLNINHYIDTMIFDDEVETILIDSEKQIYKNIRHLNIIEPELTETQLKEISQNYTKNMQFYIKKWTVNHISEMREKVKQLVLEGYRADTVKEMLKKEYGMSSRKATFLAQNETSIMLAELKRTMYTQMGFNEFKWVTILDSKERPLHHQLNGKIFRFDNPPIIDERTAQRGLPGETYNCRCSLIPYKRDSVFNGV